jgi:hypothetical protein
MYVCYLTASLHLTWYMLRMVYDIFFAADDMNWLPSIYCYNAANTVLDRKKLHF